MSTREILKIINSYYLLFLVLVEDVNPAEPSEVLYQKNVLFNKFDESDLISGLKNFQKKKAEAILNVLKSQPDQLSFDTNGVVFIEGRSIPDSNIKEYLNALFTGGKKSNSGFQDFVIKLQQMGLSQYISKKSLHVRDESELTKFVL